jgi:glycosyltransferase involved in cell wall biosynthesis
LAIIRAQRPRVLFCVNLYPALYGAVVAAAVGAGRPAIVALVNTTDFGPGERWRQPFYRQILKRFDWTVYGCEIQREQWIGRSDRSRTRTQVIYNGVDVAEFSVDSLAAERSALREHASYAGDPFIIGSVGHLNAAKNHRVLIDSIAQLRRDGIDARLIIVGEGPLRAALERQAADRGVLEVVTFTGAIQDVRRTLAILDVFVLPSLYVETFSNAALEAMAMNTPVILSRVGGAAEMIEDGKTGFLVDPHELHERLPKLLAQLARNPGTRRELGARARQHVERDFSLQNMVQRYEDLIQRVGR